MLSIGYKLRMTNGDTFYIKADGDIDAVAMWVTKKLILRGESDG